MADGERMSDATGWQPIETAPRDGTQIIGYDPDWETEQRIWWDESVDAWLFVEGYLAYVEDAAYPSWWRPAPELPKTRPHYTEANSPPYDGGDDNDGWSA